MNKVGIICKRLEEANFRVNIEKTYFMQSSIGIKPDSKKVEAIENLLPPTNLKELNEFLGTTSCYRRFIKNYAKVAKPLTNLTRLI